MPSLATIAFRDRLQGLRFGPGQLKTAELGGGEDQPFEMAFSNLAHSYLRDKAPKLLEHEVGFQLIDKDQDNTKAVGVFGFKVGNQWLYAPVFFLNGDLKGHELLYIKNQDVFVPLKESWVNYILGRKPSILGEGLNRNLSLVGVMPPNLYQLSRSPHKFAAAQEFHCTSCDHCFSNASGVCPKCGRHCRKELPKMAAWAQDVMPDLAYFATTSPKDDPKFASLGNSVPELLKDAGEPLFRFLVEEVGTSYPAVFDAVDRCWPGLLDKTAQEIALSKKPKSSSILSKDAHYPGCGKGPARPYKPQKAKKITRPRPVKHASIMKAAALAEPTMKSKKVQVVTSKEVMEGNQADLVHNLSKDEREVLLRERVVIRDDRDDHEVTLAYNVQTRLKLQNPDRTNIYNVLVKPDRFENCLVIFGPHDHRGRQVFCTCVSLDSKRWINIHPSRLWTESEFDDEAFRSWFSKLPEADSLEKGGLKIVLSAHGQGTCRIKVQESHEEGGGSKIYDVHFDNWAELLQPLYQQDYKRDWTPFHEGPYHGSHIRLTGRPGKAFKVTDCEVCVPTGCKVFTIKPGERKDGDDPEENSLKNAPRGQAGWSKDEPLQPGNMVDLQLLLASTTVPLKLYADGRDVSIDEAKKMNKVSALVELVGRYGLREKTARTLLERAFEEGIHGRSFSCLLYKQAVPGRPTGDMVAGAPNAPPFPEPNIGWDPMTGSNVPTMTESEFNVKVPDLSASRTDRSIYQPQGPDPRSMQVAQQAAQTGQREIFDTAALGGLLKAVRPESMVDRYLGNLMKGVDALGRILFSLFWHGEEFAERYGQASMPELEDGLRNAFESTGEILLELRQKTADPDPSEGTDPDLSAIANQ